MKDSLKAKTLKGAFWTVLERIGTQGVGFVVTIVLARLLSPSDYGVIGMLSVFLSISLMFVDCGFSSALIQKKNSSDADYSTVFWYNLVIACVCYAALFFGAPVVASFYKMPSLQLFLRVLGLTLIINALYTVQVTRLTVAIDFKTQAKISILRCVVSGIVGIGFAYLGYGAWALVWQTVISALFGAVAFWVVSGWRPRFLFSWPSFVELFGFGSRLMLANFLHTIYANISPLIVGRKYTAADLGQYTRADSMAALPGTVFQSTLGRVLFPVLASIQDDEVRLRRAYNKYLKLMTSIVAPSMLLLAAVSEPFIVMMIGEKWLPCVPYLQLLALGWMIDPIVLVNLNVLYVKGRSDVVLKLEIVKKVIAITIVVISVQYGVLWLCIGRVIYSYIALLLNLKFCGPFIGIGFFKQMREVAPIYLAAGAAAFVAYLTAHWFLFSSIIYQAEMRAIVSLIVASVLAMTVYGLTALVLKFDLVVEGRQLLTGCVARIKGA